MHHLLEWASRPGLLNPRFTRQGVARREGKPSAGSPRWQCPARGGVIRRSDDRLLGATLHRHRSYGSDPSTLVFGNVSSFAGGGANGGLGRPGGNCQRVLGTPAVHAPRSTTESVRGLPRGGDPAVFHSLEEWAHTGPSRSLQGAARRPRPTSLAMMSRRVVERRRVEKKW